MLGNFPLSPRIRTLLLGRNRVATIQPTLPNSIPNLRTLVLSSNSFAELADLDVLGKFARLTHLVLLENPVTKNEVRETPPYEKAIPPFWTACGMLMGRRAFAELSLLDPLAVPGRAVSGLPKSQRRREAEGEGPVWLGRRSDGACLQGWYPLSLSQCHTRACWLRGVSWFSRC